MLITLNSPAHSWVMLAPLHAGCVPAQEGRGPSLQEPVAVTFGSKLPEAGETGIIVPGAVEFARGTGASGAPPGGRGRKVAWKMGRVSAKHSDVHQMDE